jgi:hypothetical protein
MTRSDLGADLLFLLGLGSLVLGALNLGVKGSRSVFDGFTLLSFAILATGCLCTAAVLSSRRERGP